MARVVTVGTIAYRRPSRGAPRVNLRPSAWRVQSHIGSAMARPIWRGSISFGLVAIPAKIYPAIESHRPVFHEVESGTGRRIRYKRVAEGSGREVPWEN